MSKLASGGLSAAVSGEHMVGVSTDRPEPVRITCKWPCSTVLRAKSRQTLLELKAEVVPEVPVEVVAEEEEEEKPEPIEKMLTGLCELHKRKTRLYLMGLEDERPPFIAAEAKAKAEAKAAKQPPPPPASPEAL